LIDLTLIEECRKGDFRNFRKVITAASPLAYSVAFRMLGDEDIAKDVVQETMITIWGKIGKINSTVAFKTWLYRITYNKCCDYLRRKKVNAEVRADEKGWKLISEKVSSDNVHELENNEMAAIIKSLTEKLSPKQKAVFVFSDLQDLSHEEISEITGMSRRNIKANLHFARKRIGEMIERYI
jgi:RNA polymerase sigma-70 factor (ECF subfamily)